MSDRGTPASWRHMNGFGSHTFLWYNAGGAKYWVKYHFTTDQGVQNFSNTDREHLVHNITVHAGAPQVTPAMR